MPKHQYYPSLLYTICSLLIISSNYIAVNFTFRRHLISVDTVCDEIHIRMEKVLADLADSPKSNHQISKQLLYSQQVFLYC